MKYVIGFLVLLAAGYAANAITITGQTVITGQFQAVSGSFSAPAKAISLSPANGATHVPLAGPVSWANGGGATSYKLYLDATPTNPPTTLVQNNTATSYTPSLSYNTVYYYRVDPVNGAGTTTGDVISFTSLPTYTADAFTGFENSTAGTTLTTTILDAGLHTSAGGWTTALSANASGGGGKVAGNNTPPYTPLSVSGTPYDDLSGTRNITFDLTLTDNYATFTPPSTGDHWTARINFTMPTNSVGGGSYAICDFFLVKAGSNQVLAFQTSSTANTVRFHAVASDGSAIISAQTYNYTPGTTYALVVDAVRHGTCTAYLYNYLTGVLLQTFTLDCSTDANTPWQHFYVGRQDTHGTSPATGVVEYDGFAVSLSAATIGP